MNETSIFFPLRAGSTRAVKKNTRPFRPDGRSLFQHKMEQVEKIASQVKEIIVSTNDNDVISQFQEFKRIKNARIIERPDELCRSTTKVQDLIDYVPKIINSDHIFWMHATSPFVDESDYQNALEKYSSDVVCGDYDSLMSVTKIQQFIWDDERKKIINCDRSINPWPNTQDLVPVYEVNHSFYISSRNNYLKLRDRIGLNPSLHISEGLKKIDIDWEHDFMMAQNLFNMYSRGIT